MKNVFKSIILSFLMSSLALSLFACGDDLHAPPRREVPGEQWELTEPDMGQDEVQPDCSEETQADLEEHKEETQEPRSEWCEKKLRDECDRLRNAVRQGYLERDVYMYMCFGPGKDKFQC